MIKRKMNTILVFMIVSFVGNLHLVSFVVSSNETNCQNPLGMESGDIANSQLLASSETGKHPATKGRLNGAKAWKSGKGDTIPWIQVDFQKLVIVTKIATQGKADGREEYVTSYEIEYSFDNVNWQFIKDEDDTNKVFSGNMEYMDRNAVVSQMFPSPVSLMLIRIHPTTCQPKCALRFELYGCEVPTTTSSSVTTTASRDTAVPNILFTTDARVTTSMLKSSSTRQSTKQLTKSTYVQTTPPSTWSTVTPMSSIDANVYSTDTTDAMVTSTTSKSISKQSIKYNDGAVAGSVIGVLILVILVIALMIWLLKRRRRKTASASNKTGLELDGPYDLTIEGTDNPTNAEPGYENTLGKAQTAKDTDGIYHDVQDKSYDYVSAYAEVEVNDSKKANNKGFVDIYATSQYGDRPLLDIKDNQEGTSEIYHDINDTPNDYTYVNADAKTDPLESTGRSYVEEEDNDSKKVNNKGLVDIYGTSQYGGRPSIDVKENKEDTGEIYHDINDTPNEYAYADARTASLESNDHTYTYADMKDEDSKKANNKGVVDIYATSQYGGRPSIAVKENKEDTGEIYHDINDTSNEHAYTYADAMAASQESNDHTYTYADMEDKDSKATSNKGIVDIYATSQYGGRPSIDVKENKEDTGEIYHDINDTSNEHAYTYADAMTASLETNEHTYTYADMKDKDSKVASNKGIVDIYATSQYGGRPSIAVKENKEDTGEIYHDISDTPNEYAYADARTASLESNDHTYAYADMEDKDSKVANNKGIVDIYATSQHGGRPTIDVKENKEDSNEIYHDINDTPNERA